MQYMIYIHSPADLEYAVPGWCVTAAVCSCCAIQWILTMWCAVCSIHQPASQAIAVN